MPGNIDWLGTTYSYQDSALGDLEKVIKGSGISGPILNVSVRTKYLRTRSLRDEFSFAEKACALEVSLRGMEIYKAAFIVERICRAKEYFSGRWRRKPRWRGSWRPCRCGPPASWAWSRPDRDRRWRHRG